MKLADYLFSRFKTKRLLEKLLKIQNKAKEIALLVIHHMLMLISQRIFVD